MAVLHPDNVDCTPPTDGALLEASVGPDWRGQSFCVMALESRGQTRALLRGELDIAAIPGLVDVLMSLGAEEIDLTTLTFIDARGLTELLKAEAELRKVGVPCRIVGARGAVRRVFNVAGLLHRLGD
jgi:anti-anti-sigma factor